MGILLLVVVISSVFGYFFIARCVVCVCVCVCVCESVCVCVCALYVQFAL